MRGIILAALLLAAAPVWGAPSAIWTIIVVRGGDLQRRMVDDARQDLSIPGPWTCSLEATRWGDSGSVTRWLLCRGPRGDSLSLAVSCGPRTPTNGASLMLNDRLSESPTGFPPNTSITLDCALNA